MVYSANAFPKSGRKTTLVMLSGGIDSVYTLAKLLSDTDDDILVHHVHMMNNEGRYRAEATSCEQIVSFCRSHYRDFRYSFSGVDHTGLLCPGFDMIIIGFEAGVVSHSYFAASGKMPDRWTVGSCLEEGGWPDRWKHVEACAAASCYPKTPPPFYSLPIIPKLEEIDYLPPELLGMCWTCRTPLLDEGKFIECGTCKTCKLIKRLQGIREDTADKP